MIQPPTYFLRSPSGKSFPISRFGFHEISCSSTREMYGQWLVYSRPENPNVVGIFNGSRVENIGETILFNSKLDETGETFLILLDQGRTTTIRLYLTTTKLSIEDHHNYVSRYIHYLGHTSGGAHSVGGQDDHSGRLPHPSEIVHKIIDGAARVVVFSTQIRDDLPKHERETGGITGIDALETLAQWKHHPSWYRRAVPGEEGLAINEQDQVIALRAAPRSSRIANAFIGAITIHLEETIRQIPRSAGGMIIASLLQNARNTVQGLELGATFTTKQAQQYLASTQLPSNSQQLVNAVSYIREAFLTPSLHGPSIQSYAPYFLHPAETIFQRVGVMEILMSFGLPEFAIKEAQVDLASDNGLSFGNYIAWADTNKHGLIGWRDSTSLPSGYKPDLVLVEESSGRRLLLDAKLRLGQAAESLLSTSGVKDLQAYMQEYELTKAVMLVPSPHHAAPQIEDLKTDAYMIRAVSLPSHHFEENLHVIRACCEEMWND